MKPTKMLTSSLTVGTAAFIVLFLSQYIARSITPLDLGQLVLLIFFIYPFVAFLYGVTARSLGLSIFAALLSSAAVFILAILVWHNPTGLVYAPIYAVLTLGGYGLAALINRLLTKRSDQRT